MFRDSKRGAALRHLPSGYTQVNTAWMWGSLLAASIAGWLHQLTGVLAGDDLIAALARAGIDCSHAFRPDHLPTDCYLAIEGANGLIAAIADAHSLEAAGDRILAPLADGRFGTAAAPWAGTVALDGNRDFIGKEALVARQQAGVGRKLAGLVLLERGVLRSHQKVFAGAAGEGETTSGTFSPTLERAIGLARLPAAAAGAVEVEIRGKRLPARIVKPPFVRNGRILIEL